MTTLFTAAGTLLALTGVVHSILGEVMIFRKLSNKSIVPNQSAPPLSARNIRILWASWHLISIFGWVFAAILIKAGGNSAPNMDWLANAIAGACLAGGLLVLTGTRGRHPGWIALTLAAALTWTAAHAT
jgi:hypothetical protein